MIARFPDGRANSMVVENRCGGKRSRASRRNLIYAAPTGPSGPMLPKASAKLRGEEIFIIAGTTDQLSRQRKSLALHNLHDRSEGLSTTG